MYFFTVESNSFSTAIAQRSQPFAHQPLLFGRNCLVFHCPLSPPLPGGVLTILFVHSMCRVRRGTWDRQSRSAPWHVREWTCRADKPRRAPSPHSAPARV